MSRNAKKIVKALAEKGYAPGEMRWDPIRRGAIMCGPEGGWYIEVMLADSGEYVDTILAYSTAEAIEGIKNLPFYTKEERSE